MGFINKSIWFIKGMREYTKGGYQRAAQSFNAADLQGINVNGKVYMITGANSGVGKEIATEIAKHGGTVHLVCRSEDRGKTAMEEIKSVSNNQEVHLHVVDLAEPVEVYKFAKQFSASQERLDALVNNAGCMRHERIMDSFGFEYNFRTNSLSPYILTETLIPLLKKSQDPRVIYMSSGGMYTQKLDLSDLQSTKVNPFDATPVYAQHKRQQVIVVEQLAKKYPDVYFSSMHPGWADTPAVRDSMPSFYERMKDNLRSAAEGADTGVWLAISPAANKAENGSFFQDRQAVPKHLPLSWTQSSRRDEEMLLTTLNGMLEQVKSAAATS